MADYKLMMPRMGESVIEATILLWRKKPGDKIELDETVLEVATDKVDSDVPSPVEGVMKEILFEEGDTVEVGKVLAIIETEQEVDQPDIEDIPEPEHDVVEEEVTGSAVEKEPVKVVEESVEVAKAVSQPIVSDTTSSNKYYTPLVLNIAQTEGISVAELEQIQGSGKGGRVTKEDMLAYIKNRSNGPSGVLPPEPKEILKPAKPIVSKGTVATASTAGSRGDEIIEMDRVRKLIANHMINSINTSAHVSSFVEADLTNVVLWRNKHKNDFEKREGFKLSFMPIFVEAIVEAIKEFPWINVSVDGDKIIKKKSINVGVATALPSGNLIVPVIKDADQKSLVGIAREMNEIVQRARTNSLRPDDTQGGTYTISNIGTFGNILGTPIINQPQVAIMAVGSITKKPSVLETPQGDVIAIRHKMYLSHTYDHRVVDGMLGGLFVKYVGDYLEKWPLEREV